MLHGIHTYVTTIHTTAVDGKPQLLVDFVVSLLSDIYI